MTRLQVDRDRCIGAGQCVFSAETVFDQDDAGLVVLIDADPPPERLDAVRSAAELCPARAISLGTAPRRIDEGKDP